MGKVFAKVEKEFLAMLPPTIFFFVILHILALVRALMIEATGFTPLSTASIAVTALILGKAVLIADMLPFINRFPERPLFWNVVWKTVIYGLLSMLIHYLEHLVEFSRQAGGLVAGQEKLLAEIVWPHFWAIQIILWLLIVIYCATRELARLIGQKRMLRMFFGPLPRPVV